MRPVIVVVFGALVFGALLGAGCAVEAGDPTNTGDRSPDGVEMVGIGGDGRELPSPSDVASPSVRRRESSASPAIQTLADDSNNPWQSVLGPVPDPWKGKTRPAPAPPAPAPAPAPAPGSDNGSRP